jgi:hypothetical protein
VTATRWQFRIDRSDGWKDIKPLGAAQTLFLIDRFCGSAGRLGVRPPFEVRLWSPPCSQCDRSEGSRAGRHGEPVDPMGGELGPVRVCEVCGRVACPECYAESVCCGTNH